jgi:dUTP pyrophosphatase
VTPTPFVYLAHPIDFEETTAHAAEASFYLMQQDLAAYVPGYAFKIPAGAPPNEALNRINRAALSECAALVAILPRPGKTSIGVPMEIEQARAEGKPTLIIGDFETLNRAWALPHTDLTIFSEGLHENPIRALREMILRERKLRNKKPPARSIYFKLDPGGSIPTRAYDGDAGFDLYVSEEMTIQPRAFLDVPVGCAVQLPDRVWAMITGRSSTVRKLDLLVTTGVIDTGYRGPLYAGVRSLRNDPYTIKRGERIAQLIPFPNVEMDLHAVSVDVLSSSDRGEAGFGSSGA